MISAAHVMLFSVDAEADRAFLRDVCHFPHVDVGGGWLIFRLPKTEVAVHPDAVGGRHELYFIVDDVVAFHAELDQRGVPHGEVKDEGWGLLTTVTLPSGAQVGAYEPRHAHPEG